MAVLARIGNEIGLEICRKLGIDPSSVTSIDIRLEAGGLAKVTVMTIITAADGANIAGLIKHYNLVPIG